MRDGFSSPGGHERYTHGHAEPVIRSHSVRTVENSLAYGLSRLHPGMSVLDLGCGPGTITADIARLVWPGRVLAVDIDSEIVATAEEYARSRGITTIDFRVMDGYDLDCTDGAFDFTHAHQLLQHLSDPVAVLRELARVTRKGGTIAVRESDYGAFTWYPADNRLDQWLWLYHQAARDNGGEPDAGRRLLSWAYSAGLTNVTATSSSWTYGAGPAAQWWGQLWADRMLYSAITIQLLDSNLATIEDLQDISQGWLDWAASPDAWFMVPSGEILATVT